MLHARHSVKIAMYLEIAQEVGFACHSAWLLQAGPACQMPGQVWLQRWLHRKSHVNIHWHRPLLSSRAGDLLVSGYFCIVEWQCMGLGLTPLLSLEYVFKICILRSTRPLDCKCLGMEEVCWNPHSWANFMNSSLLNWGLLSDSSSRNASTCKRRFYCQGDINRSCRLQQEYLKKLAVIINSHEEMCAIVLE